MTNEPANKGLTFAIFCAVRVDVRNSNLTREEAQAILECANKGDKNLARKMALSAPNAVDKLKAGAALPAKKETAKPKGGFAAIWQEAWNAGVAAAHACVPVPMGVVQRANPLDDTSAIVHRFPVVNDGVCGFASVHFPANTAFGKWAKEQGHAKRDEYRGGLYAWIFDYRQSLAKKEAHASAMVAVLCAHGIKAYSTSRMD